MTPPFKSFPLVIRLMLIGSMYLFNLVMVSALVLSILQRFFGFANPLEAGTAANLTALDINGLLVLQAFSTLGSFMLTAMMFSVLESGDFIRHLRLNRAFSWKMLFLAVVSILVAQFFIGYLVELNGKIPLPDALKSLKEQEKQIENVVNAFSDFKSLRRLIIISLVLAVIPAIAEEMFFRGLILGDMLKAKVSPIRAIVASGFIFAVFHFEFQNTLAIWVLGCFLGYLYYVSGSLWLSIAAHFANNFLEVLLKYLYNIRVLNTDLSNSSVPIYLTAISILLFILCLFIFNKWRVEPSFDETEFANEQMME